MVEEVLFLLLLLVLVVVVPPACGVLRRSATLPPLADAEAAIRLGEAKEEEDAANLAEAGS